MTEGGTEERVERRYIELRALDGNRVSGVAVPYGRPSRVGPFVETIAPGAYAPIGELRLNVMHERARQIAINREGGGLVLHDGPSELRLDLTLPQHGEGPAVAEMIARGVYRGFSVEQRVSQDRWEGRSRLVQRARLVGLALVDEPAHEAALLDLEKRFAEVATGDDAQDRVAPLGWPSRRRRAYWL